MVSILDYPDKEDLLDRILNAFNEAKEQVAEDNPESEEDILDIQAGRVMFVGPFANDLAELGQNEFNIIIAADVPGFLPIASRRLNEIQEIAVDNLEPSETMMEWSAGISLTVLDTDNLSGLLRSEFDNVDQMAYDILRNAILELEDSGLGTFRVTEEILDEPEEEEIPEEEPEEEEEIEFEHLPVELRQYGVDESDTVDIPINKDSHKIEARELYPFEIEMMTPGDAGTQIEGTIYSGIGGAIERMSLGQYNNEGEFEPPSSFPRTGSYIKYHLLYRGPEYVMQMYRDIVIYSGYISTIYEGRYSVGAYNSFREYLYRLIQVPERGIGPELIRKIPSEEAVQRGFDLTPELPTGEEAPWLENRQYYEVVEENINHEAWDNISAFIYGEPQQ